MSPRPVTIDANQAVAAVAHRLSELIAIYPITPSSLMGELADEWSAMGRPNLWGDVPRVIEMQSEAGVAGCVHGALQAGALATTFTSSQGLLLMLPDMFKLAGELTPFTLHVAARTLATHALSIFGDHSDVMTARTTGFALLCSSSVQEAQDFAAIAHAVTLRARVPFLHFFDGFRTSHELNRVIPLEDGTLETLVSRDGVAAHRARALSPDRPVLRGSSQNPDVFFQAREAANPFFDACPGLVQATMDDLARLTGRGYRLFEYAGHPDAERVLVLMGSAAETARETVDWLVTRGERVGVLTVRLYRPFDVPAFLGALPASARRLAVLDRTREPGAIGEPLYLDVVAALAEGRRGALAVGGRYGLSSKEFTPAMARAVLDELSRPQPRNHFTIGITDDVTHRSLPWDATFELEAPDVVRAVFYGLGSDGTVSSNKQAVTLIGEETDRFAQGFFVYDSKKAGTMTTSHLRFGPRPIHAPYLVRSASFVACHAPSLLQRVDLLEAAAPGATFLLNTPHPPDVAFAHLPREVQQRIIDAGLRLFVIDAAAIARDTGLESTVGTIMQACFFRLAGVLPADEALSHLRRSVEKAYGKHGPEIVRRNVAALDAALTRLHPAAVPPRLSDGTPRPPTVPPAAPDFVQRVTALLLAGKGDQLPVSAFPPDGTWPTGTSRWEKRGLATEAPRWDEQLCIQCNKCALICPHAAIRSQLVDPASLASAPIGFVTVPFRATDLGTAPSGHAFQYTLQVAPDDCTGCGLCVEVCPARDKATPRHRAIDLAPLGPQLERAREHWRFFETLPHVDRRVVPRDVKASQFLEPLFEFPGACAGCGETPYLKLVSQLFGDRMLVANATGCSSIFGGNLPTTPWCANADGRGPAWSNSLFEDNAEFGLGMRLALDAQAATARRRLASLAPALGDELVRGLLDAPQGDEREIAAQRARVAELRQRLVALGCPGAHELHALADHLVRKSVWIVGGDGWAYDIGYGGLDHVLASGADVNVLVLDTEVYSNTGGQASKATPLGAAARFASAGKATAKKDLGLLAMSLGNVYVASIAIGAKDAQALEAIREAERFPGPSLVIAYSHCIAHGYDLAHGAEQQRLAVGAGLWPLYRFDPRRLEAGEAPLQLDSPAPRVRAADYMDREGRFRQVALRDPARSAQLVAAAEAGALRRRALYEQLARLHLAPPEKR